MKRVSEEKIIGKTSHWRLVLSRRHLFGPFVIFEIHFITWNSKRISSVTGFVLLNDQTFTLKLSLSMDALQSLKRHR